MPKTPETSLEPKLNESPADKPAYRPFPAVAKTMRAESDHILAAWRTETLRSMPDLADLTVKEFEDDIARILAAMADALESNDPPDLKRLMQVAPSHGFQRFLQEYDLSELFAEERVLRRVIVSQIEAGLKRQCRPDEAAALHAMIDIMLQQGVLALVQEQKQELRQVSEIQLKYLSYLSHDLNNNFFLITMNLEHIERLLKVTPNMGECCEVITASLATLRQTRDGMRGLLQHESMRRSDPAPSASPVNLRKVVEPIVKLAASDSLNKGVRVEIAIDPQATATTNADVLAILLQNLIGNAIKHTVREAGNGGGGTVQIEAKHQYENTNEFWNFSVIDDGPGIPEDQLERLFNAFEQMPPPGEHAFDDDRGFGLGLAIASQAARLLGTSIEVKSEIGGGSKFSIRLPAFQSAPQKA